jgi:hypothetical protein
MAVVELLDGAAVGARGGGEGDGARVFLAERVDHVTAIDLPEVPRVGDTHPRLAGLKADTVQSVQSGPHSTITVRYSTDGRNGTPTRPVELLPDFSTMDTAFRRVKMTIPVGKRRRYDLPTETGSVETRYAWVPEPVEFEEVRVQWTFKATVELSLPASVGSQFQILSSPASQADKLHSFGGVDYLFTPRVLSNLGPSRYRVEYLWELDQGTPATMLLGASPAPGWAYQIGSTNTIYPVADGGEFLRLPYHAIETEGDPDDDDEFPAVRQVRRYARDPNGWQTLLGIR